MYRYVRQILLRETDSTGVLFFSEQLNMALEALESYFLNRGFTFQKMVDCEGFAMPIVRAEADYFSPLKVGNRVEVELTCVKMGETSFTLGALIRDREGKEVGTTEIIHVCISLKTGRPIPIPAVVSAHLSEL